MIRPQPRLASSKYHSLVAYFGLVVFIGLSVVRTQASLNPPPYAGKEVRPDAGVISPVQENQQTRHLELSKPLERELAGGQSHPYKMTLSAGQLVKLAVDQRGIDVVVKLFGSDGKQIIEFDSERRTQGKETISWVAEEAGSYRMDVLAKQKDAAAGRYEIQVVELRLATENDRALHEARKVQTEFVRLYRAGKYDEARPLAERVLEIREKVLGPEHTEVAQAINNLAIVYQQRGDYAKAESLFQRAMTIREKVLGPEHPDTAQSLNNLASFYRRSGYLAKAESLYQRSLTIREKVLGPEHPEVAHALNSLASLYLIKGDYAEAEPLYQRALTIRVKALGQEHPDCAASLNDLAILYKNMGDYAKAEPLYQSALTIREKVLGPEHPEFATSLNNLAILYKDIGDYAKAEPLYQGALAIREKALGREHPDFANSLDNLAILYRNRGDHTKAEPLYHRALAIKEKALVPEHPDIANTLNNLAILYFQRGNYAKAESLYQRALTMREKVLGPEHPDVANPLSRLAVLYAAIGNITQAIAFQSRANAIDEGYFAINLAIGSERQKLTYLSKFSVETDFTLWLHSQAAPNDPQALDLALTTLLRRKGRGLDAMTDTIATLRRHATPQDQALFDKLIETRSRLASLTLKEPDAAKPDTYRTQLKLLKEDIDELEADLSTRSAEFRAQSQPVTLAAVQAALPKDSALAEFAVYSPVDPQTEKSKPPRYLAYLLPAEGKPNWVDLGEAASIDRAVDAWRKALRSPNRTDVKRLARAVDEKVMRPVRSLLSQMPGDTSRLLIAPDGSLNLIPFAALVDERNRYLIERYSISYLTCGRDLLRLGTPQLSKGAPLLVANPDFGRFTTIAMRGGENSGKSRGRNRSQAQIDPKQIFFQPLPATEDEALAIKAVLPKASVLRRDEATETALKQADRPQILHIATHGFFFDYQEPTPAESAPSHVASSGTSGPVSAQAIPYTVQLEAIPASETANEKVKRLKAQGVDAYIFKSKAKGKGTLFRVRVGNFPTQAEANKYGADLQKKGVISEFIILRYQPPQRDLTEPAPTIAGTMKKRSNSPPVAAPPANSQTVSEPPLELRLSKFTAQVKNPLLRSGLALAGANHGKSGDEDGILTALEAAYLDLSGTKLVVLSACDTGVGEVKNGEGVQGLRRALVLAGSESQVMSLWPVSDEATKDLMIPYYKALQQGEGRSEGLRQVQLRMLRGRKDQRHPFYWAAFIQSGDWANLEGQR
jgi:CHAT domain-containing protein/Flp pilus assembly protein TadD